MRRLALGVLLLLASAGVTWAQGTVTGNGTISIAAAGPVGTPAYAANGAGCPISNDETHTSDTVTAYSCQLPNATIAGNLLVVTLRYHTPAQTPTWTDNVGGNVYTLATTCTDATNATVAALYYVQGVKSGVVTVTPHFSPAVQFVEAQPFEFVNAGVLDSATCTAAAGTTVTAPALTAPPATGDLLFQFGAVTNETPLTSCIRGSQPNVTWTLRSTMMADDFPSCVQYGVYASTASIAPEFGISATASYVTAAAAFKAATTGAAPPGGIRVAYVQHDNTENETAASIPLQFPVSGNAFAVLYNSGCSGTSNTDCSYPTSVAGASAAAQIGATIISNFGSDGGNSVGNAWLASAVTPGTFTPTWTMHTRSSGGNGNTFLFYDIVGAAASPLDTGFGTSGLASDTFDQTSGGAGGPLTTWTATPSAANEVTLAVVGSAFNTWTAATSPTGARFLSCNYVTQTNPSHCDLNSGNALYYNGGSTAAQTWIWQHDTSQDPGTGAGVSLGIALHP